MPKRILEKIRRAVEAGAYDMTVHAMDEMAEDDLGIHDVENAIISGKIAAVEKDDVRGTRYALQGPACDGETMVGVVGRFKETGTFLIITVYERTGERG